MLSLKLGHAITHRKKKRSKSQLFICKKRCEFASVYRIQTWRGQWREPVKILPFTRKVEISSLLIQQVVLGVKPWGKNKYRLHKNSSSFLTTWGLMTYLWPLFVYLCLCLLCSNTLTYAEQARHLSSMSFPGHRKTIRGKPMRASQTVGLYVSVWLKDTWEPLLHTESVLSGL